MTDEIDYYRKAQIMTMDSYLTMNNELSHEIVDILKQPNLKGYNDFTRGVLDTYIKCLIPTAIMCGRSEKEVLKMVNDIFEELKEDADR